MQPVCHACQKPIPGRSITALGHVYHPEHFVCAQCHCQFPDSKFYEVEGKPYCELHYKQLFAERCSKCDKPILGEVTRACGKCWQKDKTGCEKLFPTMQFWSWEEKPYCTKSFDSLAEKVRRKILKKQEMETKLDGYKERAERLEKSTRKFPLVTRHATRIFARCIKEKRRRKKRIQKYQVRRK